MPDPLPPTESMAEGLLKGRYLLGPELGRGGFAITYLAADLEVASRKVVVKVLNERRSSDSWSVKKFKSEMEALARIDHPNVVGVIDYGQSADGKPFLVMQYVPGRSLREMIPREGLPLAQVAQIIRQTGRALTAAHEAGVCHSDVKPENVMMPAGAEGEAQIKLIDFGLARVRTAESDSQSSSVAGTHTYMAPEQFEGKSSVASDIYQMGVLAYELVTGIVPFRATTPGGFVLQQMEGLKVLPRSLRPDLPEAAQEIMLKALSPDPRDRPQRARDFGDALAGALVSGNLDAAGWVTRESSARSSSAGAYKSSRRRRMIRAAILAGVLAIAATAYFVLRSHAARADSVAVLPFQNRTGDPGMAYVTEGITESLINDLSRIPRLRVISRGSVLKYDNPKRDPQAAGRQLGVRRVIDGSVWKRGDDFSMNTELIDVQSGVRLWGNDYSGKFSSLTGILQKFSIEVTDQLRLKLSGTLKQRLARQYATRSEAYQDYLKGRFHLNKRTAADFQEAIDYFNKAIAADPDYAPAYSGLADTYGFMAVFRGAYGGMIPADALQQSRVAAKRALELDGTLAEAYAALAFVEMQADYAWDAAERDFLRALQLNPNWASAHEFYAFDLGAVGRFDEALREIETAERLDPSSIGIKLAHAQVLRIARRPDDSLAILQNVGKTSTGRGLAADFMAENYWVKSMPAQALAAIEGIPSTFNAPFRVPLLIAAYARAGQNNKARQLLNSYVVQPDTAEWYYLALAHLGLHETENAIDDLERAYEQRYQDVIWLGFDPMVDELRGNSRFKTLLGRIRQHNNNLQ